MISSSTTLEILRKSPIDELFWTKSQVGSILGVSISSVNNYMALEKNPLGFVKLGAGKKSAIRIPVEALAKFIDGLSTATIEEENGEELWVMKL